jgi:quercetin dioxygenase-like cupin family protein
MKRLTILGVVVLAAVFSLVALQTAVAQEPLKVAPDMYKLLHENDRVRVMEVTFKPGSKIAKHSHPDHTVYAVTGGKLKIFHDQGEPMEADLKPGDVMWIAAESHWAENVGTTEIRLLVTELKEPAPAKPKTAVK